MASFSQSPPPCFSSAPINHHNIRSFSYNHLSHHNKYSSFFNSSSSRISCSNTESNNPPKESSSSSSSPETSQDPIKLAFARAKAYKNSLNDFEEKEAPLFVKNSLEEAKQYKNGAKEVPLALKLALEKAKEYKKNKDEGTQASTSSGNGKSSEYEKEPIERVKKNMELKISSIDFVGLNFADKKTGRALPAGLVPISDPFPEGELPEVEIIVGDKSRFVKSSEESATATTEEEEEDGVDDLYKPKVSTWGVFPRPNDISRTYGGGRNLRPGEALETAEEKAAKERRTKQLVAAYKSQIGMNIDPKLKSECENALKEGDSLMDLGKLKEAIPFYEEVMEKLAFQSELHGLAALQWSICQDSLSRSKDARVMYEKLQSHPSPQVSKRARQFYFSFQAMEMMKVTSLKRSTRSTGYQNYFDAFLRDKTNFSPKEDEEDESVLSQALPYFVFLVSPIFMVLLIAATRP